MLLYVSTLCVIIALICVDAGGGRPRDGKFPRSMSDFKPGDVELKLLCGNLRCRVAMVGILCPASPGMTATPAIRFYNVQ